MAGAGYKLFNTGDVLTAAQVNTFLMEQTVMVFNDATARTAALSGVLAEGMLSYLKSTKQVEVYNGTAWVASDDPNAIQNTIVDAKGDLITATAADVPARLAVGNNGETLVADSSTSTGLRWQGTTSASNPILNSSFDIWQRGTSPTWVAANSQNYQADRWLAFSAAAGRTVTRQLTGDTTNLPFIQYCARVQRTNGNTATDAISILQPMESTNSIPFAGRTVTLSFYARRGANFSSASNNLTVRLFTGTGTDENVIFPGYSGSSTLIDSPATLTTTWQRFTFTATVGATATELTPQFIYTPSGTAGAADFFEITGVQLDVGSVALPYRRNSVTLAGELAACQRYLPATRLSNLIGYAYQANAAVYTVQFPVQARVAPTGITAPAGSYSWFGLNTAYSATLNYNAASVNMGDFTGTGGNFTITAGQGSRVSSDQTILWTGCEL